MENNTQNPYRKLIVWQKAMSFVSDIYRISALFPKEELYALSSQMRRAAVSIPSNIAEGQLRGSRKEYRQFLLIAYGSCGEIETQLEIAHRLSYIKKSKHEHSLEKVSEIMKILNSIIKKLK